MTRRQSRILIACAVWTLYVWISRIVIMSGQDNSAGFKIVHGILAAVSIAFGLAVGKIGWDVRRRLRPEGTARRSAAEPTPGSRVEADYPDDSSRSGRAISGAP